jgi:hypothetical protein
VASFRQVKVVFEAKTIGARHRLRVVVLKSVVYEHPACGAAPR